MSGDRINMLSGRKDRSFLCLSDKSRFIEGFIVGNGLCAVPKNVRQMARNDTQVVPYKVFA